MPIVVSNCNIKTEFIYGDWTGGENIDVDPAFIDEMCHVHDTSQCLEAGAISLLVGDVEYFCPDHDIDGDIRPLNSTADIGVDEVLLTVIREELSKFPFGKFYLDIQPNPLSDNTTIKFSIPSAGLASMVVYNSTGQLVETICLKEFQPGEHEINWTPENLNEGVYYIHLKTNINAITKKVVIFN